MNDIERGQIAQNGMSCLYHGGNNLSAFPRLMRMVIENRVWESREVAPNNIVKLDSLLEMVTLDPLDGWGEDPKKVEALLRHDIEVLQMWRETTTLDRLKRESPELFAAVSAGKLSTNAAAIKAGFRKKTVSIQLDPESAARTILRHFTGEDIRALVELLTAGRK